MPVAIDTSLKANVTAITGSTGSGKDSRMKWILGREKYTRLAIFDPEAEYNDFGEVITTLPGLVKAMQKKAFKAVFQPSSDDATRRAQFDWFCTLAMGEIDGEQVGQHCAVVASELSLVTTPSWGPAPWRSACSRGRKRGLTVYGLSQFPAQVDKAFWSAVTKFYTGRIVTPAHARVMAEQMGVKPEELRALPDLAYIELDVRSGKLTRGQGKYHNGRLNYSLTG